MNMFMYMLCHATSAISGLYVMMKPPFKASDSAINVLWFDTCTVWFVASLSCINMTLKS